MAEFISSKMVAFACVFALTYIVCVPQFAGDVSGTEPEDSLHARVNALENTVAQLHQQIQDDKMASSLSGHYWVEQSRVLAGKREKQTEEVAWRLARDVSSIRYILGPEVSSYHYGRFSIDTSKNPAWIDFEVHRFGQSHAVKGIVRTSFGKCEIAIPGKLFHDEKFLDPARPTNFQSTADNGYDVYKLVRERYQRTGVWP